MQALILSMFCSIYFYMLSMQMTVLYLKYVFQKYTCLAFSIRSAAHSSVYEVTDGNDIAYSSGALASGATAASGLSVGKIWLCFLLSFGLVMPQV